MIRSTGIVLLCGLTGCIGLSCVPRGAVNALTGNFDAAGIAVSPRTLFSGENEITIRSDAGFSDVQVRIGTARPDLVRIEGDGAVMGCPGERTLRIWLGSASEEVEIRVGGRDCRGIEFRDVLLVNRMWYVDRIEFHDVEVGKTSCG